jgi:lipopolysaccharide cholinephosphotransferase
MPDFSPSLAEIQHNILQNFYALQQFCEDNKIRYYIIGGTLIGAVRHGGFIPWDDDIDIGMPRPDYDRFLELADKFYDQFNGRYKICHIGNEKGYINLFAKSCDTQTTVTEKLVKELTRGVWVDIFPLDGTFKSSLLRRMHFNMARILVKLCTIKSGFFLRPKGYMKRIFNWSIYKFFPISVPMFNQLITAILAIKKFDTSDYIGNFVGAWGYKEICRKELFNKIIKLKFEAIEVNAPAGYDEYLKRIYGDYMTPPPPELRHSHHLISHIDLNTPYITSTQEVGH